MKWKIDEISREIGCPVEAIVSFLDGHGIDCCPGRLYTGRQAGRIVHEALKAGLDQHDLAVEEEDEFGVEFDFRR